MFLLNIPLFFVSYKYLNKRFTIYTAIGMLSFSTALMITKPLSTLVQVDDMLLYCIYGGVLSGIGSGLIFYRNGSTGGTDIITMVIRKKYSNFDIGQVEFAFNLIIVTVSIFIFGLPRALYTLISMFITSTILDKVLNGFTSKKLLLMENIMAKSQKRYLVLLVFGLLVIIAAGVWMVFGRKTQIYEKTEEIFGNPLMGYAPCAWEETIGEDISLLYMDITWAELEPEEGKYDWEKIERENQTDRWREEGKHLVLRFVCDIPGEEKHMDIPQWLYDKTDHAGTWYDMEYGKGYAPDYNNEQMIQYHKRAVNALGEHFGRDGLVSYIELGSLGHWGEWHVNISAGIQSLPEESVRERYMIPWTEAFPDSMILMRRPFSEGEHYGIGLYNDMTGQPESTEEWFRWINEGGEFDQTHEKKGLSAMKDFWKKFPSGGEFTSSITMKELLDTNLDQTINLIKKAHTTFLGPKVADKTYENGYRKVLGSMGYRLWISQASLIQMPGYVSLNLKWKNDGVAPFYEDWPVWVLVEDEDGNSLEKEAVDISLKSLLPEETLQTKTRMQVKKMISLAGKKYKISIDIEDPMTGKLAVRFSIK